MLKGYLLTGSSLLVRRPINVQPTAQNSSVSKLNKVFQKIYQEKKIFQQETEKDRLLMQNTKKKAAQKAAPVPNSSLTPASINFMVLGNGGFATPRSVYIQTSSDYYLINCSENTQRLSSVLG